VRLMADRARKWSQRLAIVIELEVVLMTGGMLFASFDQRDSGASARIAILLYTC